MRKRREAVLLDRIDLFLGEFGSRAVLVHARQRAEGSVALVASRATGNLRHLGREQAAHAHAVELGQAGEGDVIDVEIKPHADCIGSHDVIDLAVLEERDLLVSRLGAKRAHHHRRTAAEAAQHFGHRIDLFGAEGDDRAARGQPRKLARADMRQRGKTRAIGDFRFGYQLANQRFERRGAQQHGLFTATRIEQSVGEDMAAFAIGADLRFVQRHECRTRAVARHRFGGAAHVARTLRLDSLLPGNQRDRIVALDCPDAVVDLAREQAQRKAHAAARMRRHALDRQMRLTGIGGSEDRLDRATLHRA